MQINQIHLERPAAMPGVHFLSRPRGRWLIFSLLALLALAVRLPHLGDRPMHTDESVNAYLTGEMLSGHGFHYDPQDRHGPVLYLLAEPLARLCGARNFAELTETELRLTPVIAGSITVLLFGAAVEMFGFATCLIAALLFAIAPLPLYYNRYFIHESVFVAATLGLMIFGWRALRTKSLTAATVAGLLAGLLVGCKETFIIHFFALGMAAVAWILLRDGLAPKRRPSGKIVAFGIAAFIVTVVLLFSWLGQNWSGLADLFRAAPQFAARASGAGHQKPFGYYFGLGDPGFIFSLLAIAGIAVAIRNAVTDRDKTGLPLAIYGVTIFFIYSGIPYKTPWLALNLWLPVALLSGLACTGIWRQIKQPAGSCFAGIVACALLVPLARQSVLLTFIEPASQKNPLAYAHTVEDLLRLPPQLEKSAREHQLTDPLIAVVAADPWPLPWYLRHFKRVGFWQPGQDPGQADFYLASPEASQQLSARLTDRQPQFSGVRPEVILLLWPPTGNRSFLACGPK